MRGIIRLYQNGNTVDLDCGTYRDANDLFMKLKVELVIPDVHMSIWTADDDADLPAQRREKNA